VQENTGLNNTIQEIGASLFALNSDILDTIVQDNKGLKNTIQEVGASLFAYNMQIYVE